MKLDLKTDRQDQVVLLPPIAEGERLPAIPPIASVPTTIAGSSGGRWRVPWLLLALVLVPLFVGFVYNFIIASDRFAATTSFVVRKNQTSGGVAALVQGSGFVRSDDDSFAVSEFFRSRDAVAQLNEGGYLQSVFAGDQVDVFSRFPTLLAGDTQEDLYQHFQDFIDVDFDTSTGIVTLEVQAFAPDDAVTIAERLLAGGENLINQLNTRAQNDTYEFTKAMVDDAEAQLQAILVRLTELRNSHNMIDPQGEIEINNAVMLELIKAQGEAEARLAQMKASTPRNPRISELELHLNVLNDLIERQRETLAGSHDSLAGAVEAFEKLRLERTLAEKRLVDAIASLQSAEQDAQNSHLYLQRIVEPRMPDRYAYPRRYLNMALLLLVCLTLYWILRSTTTLFLEER